MTSLTEAVLSGADGRELQRHAVPDRFRAAYLRVEDTGMFADVRDKDVRKSLHVGAVPMPELAPDEVLIAVMASAINYNTVWSATFEPLPTFGFLKHLAAKGGWHTRHDQPHHVVGSDAAGVIVRTGSAVTGWQAGDRVVVATAHVNDQEPASHADSMLSDHPRAWGFETNFGGLADYSVVRASQLLPKPAHLTWEEAACNPLCAATAYRMLVSDKGARMKQGDVVFIWGASGGLGAYAVQLVRNGGGTSVGVVSSPEKAELVRKLGCDVVIDRTEVEQGAPGSLRTPEGWKRMGKAIRKGAGEDPHIVFEHVGQATFPASVFLARRGGTVVTCGSSTGYQHQFDNRYLWMNLKRIIGSHGANLQEQWETNRLISQGRIVPPLSTVYGLDEVGEAARSVQSNRHIGKVGVLCLAPGPGLGISDPATRERVGTDRLDLFRTAARGR
ncbi:crotonyl-CoA carboxylase/reductase [Streptomyces sp. NBC_01478]|uniref:crotonyl-CoA carboxylase/reductase n=1 Tax=Streptomyces sp. NBC_01478 TaxID=2903882 RepID=UPI002E31D730|nr:crotonyl-CoA carboxylase/reductase [Streptomyces sp. NBC_01478]